MSRKYVFFRREYLGLPIPTIPDVAMRALCRTARPLNGRANMEWWRRYRARGDPAPPPSALNAGESGAGLLYGPAYSPSWSAAGARARARTVAALPTPRALYLSRTLPRLVRRPNTCSHARSLASPILCASPLPHVGATASRSSSASQCRVYVCVLCVRVSSALPSSSTSSSSAALAPLLHHGGGGPPRRFASPAAPSPLFPSLLLPPVSLPRLSIIAGA